MLEFGHQYLLTALQPPQIVYVSHCPNPIAVQRATLKRLCACLMPQILPVSMPSDTMLHVIFAPGPCIIPRFLCSLAIIRMIAFSQLSPMLWSIPSPLFNPLRARPGPLSVGPSQEDKLRNAGGQQSKTLLALA